MNRLTNTTHNNKQQCNCNSNCNCNSSDDVNVNVDVNNSSCYNADTGSGSRKRRTQMSFLQMRDDNNGNNNPYSTDDGTHISSSSHSYSNATTTTDGFASDSTVDGHSTVSGADYKSEAEEDIDLPSTTAKAASDTEDVNELLSQELLKMSLIDRQDIQEEIHCVRCLSVEETPLLLKRSLQDFQKELEALPDFKKKTYTKIVSLTEEARKQYNNGNSSSNSKPPKNYAIDDDDFRLRFLRVELFDFKKAALRFVNYFEFVHEFFGFGIASKRQVRLSDFSREELKFFKKGYFQLLPFRDRSGRRVVVILGENNNNNGKGTKSYGTNSIAMAKCYFYLWDVASRDSAESQKKGVVAIAHPNGICFGLQNHELYLVHRLSVAVPTRMVASHNFCHDFAGYKLLVKVVVAHVIAGSKHKQIIRQKFQVGLNDTEMRYYLQGFGIPIEFFPLTETGTIKLNYFNKWIKTRNYLEARDETNNNRGSTTTKSTKDNSTKNKNKRDKTVVVVECPLLNDVVFRQGKPYKANPGNDVLRDSILEELNRKMMASTASKNNGNGSLHKTTKGHSNNGLGRNNNGLGLSNDQIGSGHSSNSNGMGSEVADSTEHFCNWLVDEIEINRKGRFLTWDSTLNTWVQMFDRFKIRRKISVTLYNYEKRHSTALGKMQQRKDKAVARSLLASLDMTDHSSSSLFSTTIPGGMSPLAVDDDDMAYDDLAYRFIEGGKPSSQFCCLMNMMDNDNNTNNNAGASRNSGGERKRSRDLFSFHA